MPKEYILTIDLGTSGPKVSLFDFNAKTVDYNFQPVETIYPPGGGVEQHPAEWISAIETAYNHILQSSGIHPHFIRAINVSSQWSGTVAVDESGKVLHNALIWMDDRGAPYIRKKMSGPPKIQGYNIFKLIKWLRLTAGMPSLSGKDCTAHILYIQDQLPQVYANTKYFLEPKDYINYFLTGKFAASYDGVALHWITDNRNINQISYHQGLANSLGIDLKKLPELVPTNSILGKVSKSLVDAWKLHPDTIVVSGAPDTNTAAVGSGAVNDYEGHIYYGTSTWILTHLPKILTDIHNNMATIPSSIPGRYLLVNEQECAGSLLNFLKNNLFFDKDIMDETLAPTDFYRRLDQLIDGKDPGANGLLFLPWFNGERAPMDDHKARGAYYNLSLRHKRADFVQATFEGVALNSKWLLQAVEKNCGKPFEQIHFIGGGANSRQWCQILADVFDRPIAQIEEPVAANSRGAALLALMAIGAIQQNEIKKMVGIKEIFSPIKKHTELYQQKFEIFKSVYKKNKSIFKQLN
ncbi:MAG TPA: FGGY-family carbohydrate kinase [Niabella sp.]|nr:FGGY-family carbohydrate kinase [Niabella sp.]HOZ97651.1 FGGY-family carbohydrate kinase [Niabella sp.]HQW13957.1 FGGY-family carbohydrate kinase [Niabella sp.]HQX19500.1 FGGY-family carbohydrate kinase [Niabella sp.]HQX41461.1 FGGY-family carbohydrate kinase [Niabella sp.]